MVNRAKRASHIDPPASSNAIMRRVRPYGGENPEHGKDVLGELDHRPGIRERPREGAALPASSIALKRSTPRAGRDAGGIDAGVTSPGRRNRTRSLSPVDLR